MTEIKRHILKKLSDLESRVAQTESNQRLQDEMSRLKREEKDQATQMSEQISQSLNQRAAQCEQRLLALEQKSISQLDTALIKKMVKSLLLKSEKRLQDNLVAAATTNLNSMDTLQQKIVQVRDLMLKDLDDTKQKL